VIWDDRKVAGFDFETSGDPTEFALQPWRWQAKPAPGASWVTSVSLIQFDGQRLVPAGSALFPSVAHVRGLLEKAVSEDLTLVGWNITFDIAWLFAMGLGDLVIKVKWLDAMLLWRHLEIEPEYEFQTNRSKKKKYRLKPEGMERFLPVAAGYEEDVDFHATDPESLKKLQKYNDRDSVHTWIIAKLIWEDLTPAQRVAATIEAESLPLVAQANYEGMVIDTLACRELGAYLENVASNMLAKLAPYGVTEKVVRSPTQLAKLLFDEWKLPVLKENTGKTTGKVSRSTDKEVLHELAFSDTRCADLKRYRESLNNRAKFADGILASTDYNGDGRTRPGAIVWMNDQPGSRSTKRSATRSIEMWL
jgi:DNA polymerase I-like protein with 3'-5' exonuclease and polymerase domains